MGKLICPHCGAFTGFAPDWIMGKGLLIEQSTKARDLWDNVSIRAVTPDKPGETTYAILTCLACEKRFVAKRGQYRDEWSAVYPILHTPVAEEIPEPIKSKFEEAHLCFAVGAYRGCLLVCRAALIDMEREQMVSSLKELQDKGIISNVLYGQADQVRLWANMVGHEDVPEAITKEDTEQLLAYLAILLDTVYVQPKRLSSLSEKLRQLKKGTKPEPSLEKFHKPDSGLTT